MNDEEIDQFVEEAVGELNRKQKSVEKSFRLGKWPEYLYDAPSGQLQFKDKADRIRVQADTVQLGSYSAKSGTWQWAWANKSNPPAARKKAEELKKLFKLTSLEVFKQPTIEIDESMTWELAAMCVSHLGAKGCYHMPAGQNGKLTVFVAITTIQLLKE